MQRRKKNDPISQALSILSADIASGLVGFLAPISAWKYLIFGKIGSSLETYGVFLKIQKFVDVFGKGVNSSHRGVWRDPSTGV